MSRVTHHWVEPTFQKILRSPQGAVARDILRRCLRVESAAKKNLGRHPRRINTGLLRSSIHSVVVWRGKPVGLVGSNVHYARYVHDGTGIYGPQHRPIRPKRARVLRFVAGGKVVYARSVRGMAPNKYLEDALPFARL